MKEELKVIWVSNLSEVKSHLGTFIWGGLKPSYHLEYLFQGNLITGSQILDKGWGRRITNIYENCYLHIKCSPANSLAALMWRGYLNNEQTALQLVVESSGRSSQNQIYTCMVRMILKSWYITWEGGQRKENRKT